MASSYSPLKVELIGTGEQAGTWGTTTNTNLGTTLEEAITGRATATFPSDADYTLPYIDSNSSQVFRNLVLNVTSSGNLSSTRNLVIPAIEKQYLIENNTSGSQSIVVKTAAGSGVTVPNGRRAHVFCDGTTTRFADDFVDINGGTIDGVTIGTSTGTFTTATITTGNITTGNITTGNITTGNINTLLVGTQTNKATISYTTNAARTLTIPAVSGNRTFAFLEEAQTFTAAQTFSTTPTIDANLLFTGSARRIQSAFVGYQSSSTMFQNSSANQGTSVGALPNGTARGAAFATYNTSDPANSLAFGVYVDDDECSLFSVASGTGSATPVYISTGGLGRLVVEATGELAINSASNADTSLTIAANGRTYSLKANARVQFNDTYSYTVGATNRTLYIDNTGDIGGLSSTRESKKNIASLENVDWLMALEPVSYNRRLRSPKGIYSEEVNPNTEFGLIADDVVSVRPELCVFANGKVSGINYEQLIAPMLKEIQKLRAEIELLKAKG